MFTGVHSKEKDQLQVEVVTLQAAQVLELALPLLLLRDQHQLVVLQVPVLHQVDHGYTQRKQLQVEVVTLQAAQDHHLDQLLLLRDQQQPVVQLVVLQVVMFTGEVSEVKKHQLQVEVVTLQVVQVLDLAQLRLLRDQHQPVHQHQLVDQHLPLLQVLVVMFTGEVSEVKKHQLQVEVVTLQVVQVLDLAQLRLLRDQHQLVVLL